ncbi:MAG TPA: tartrate-resistant acid phosphatase type 5 family protein [Fibrobacteria bacterium]|nr:tartrate-resistant acid phosphatase type 5 family protein [Fibrobacteria bacterium]
MSQTHRRLRSGLLAVALLLASQAFAEGGKISFLVFGDWGWNGYNHQKELAQTMGTEAKKLKADFIVSLGDNFQVNGVRSVQDPLWRLSYEDIYTNPSMEKDWYCVLGNHDYHGNPQAEIDYTKISRRWNLPAHYYSVHEELPDGTTVDLFFLDTSPLQRQYWSHPEKYPTLHEQDTTAQLRWLDSSLTASKATWKLVFGHHPVYSGGVHAPELLDMPGRFAKRFEKGGVDAYFAGHDHHLEHIRQPGSKVNYFIDGAHEIRPVKATPASDFAVSTPGFMTVTISPDTLLVRAVDVNDVVLREFPILRTKN